MNLSQQDADLATARGAESNPRPIASTSAAEPPAEAGWRIRMVDRHDPVADVLIGELDADLDHRYADENSNPDAPPVPHYRETDIVRAAVVETSDGEPAGCGLLIRPADVLERSTTGELKHIYVRPGFRGRRLAELILDTFVDYARRIGLHRLILITGTPQPEALALYRRTGWRLIPAYGGWRPFLGAIGFEYVLWDSNPPSSDTRPVVHRPTARALVFDDQQRLLLAHQAMPSHDHWALPGGGLCNGESAVVAAARELTEETGLHVNDLAGPVITHDYWVAFADSMLHQSEQVYWARTTQQQLSSEGLGDDEDYVIDLAWWSVEDVADSDVVIYPRLLADVATALLLHGTPSEPYRITPGPPPSSQRPNPAA